jgi:hypothetical protein
MFIIVEGVRYVAEATDLQSRGNAFYFDALNWSDGRDEISLAWGYGNAGSCADNEWYHICADWIFGVIIGGLKGG